MLIGTTDLSISLGHPGEPDCREVRAAVDEIVAAGGRAGKAVATVARSAVEASREPGVTIAVFVATLVIRDALRAAAAPPAVAAATTPRGGTLILLPGMLGTAELWDDVAPTLAQLASVHAARIDLDDSVEEMAESVLVSAPDRFALAGHSLGAIVALAVTRRAPARVTGLALLNANPRAPSEAQLAEWADTETRVREGDFAAVADEFARANVPEFRRDDADLLGRIEAMALEVGPHGLLRQLAAQRARPGCGRSWARWHVHARRRRRCRRHLSAGAAGGDGGGDPRGPTRAAVPLRHMSTLETPERVGPLIARLLA